MDDGPAGTAADGFGGAQRDGCDWRTGGSTVEFGGVGGVDGQAEEWDAQRVYEYGE